MSEIHYDEMCPFIKELDHLKEKLNIMDSNLQLSAMYGKSLIEENATLKAQVKDLNHDLEKLKQENHQMRLQLERSRLSEINHLQEVDTMKETLLKMEELNKLLKSQEDESYKKELEMISQLSSIKNETLVCKEEYEAKIKFLESELCKFKNTTHLDTARACDHDEEMDQLQEVLINNREVISNLEAKLVLVEEKCLQMENTELKLRNQNAELQNDLEKQQSALTRAENLIYERKMELIEIQAMLEAERISHVDPEKRGNSIFGEVEDRRQQVEKQLVKLNSLLEIEKKRNRDLLAELTRVKNQMAFIAFGGSGYDNSKYLEQMENLVRCSNFQNKELLERIEKLQKEKLASDVIPTLLNQSNSDPKWLHVLLQQKQQEVDTYQAKIRQQIRTNLCQTEQLMQQGKHINEVEKNLQRAHGEIARLRILLEERNNKENTRYNSEIQYTTDSCFVENVKDFFVADVPETLLLKERVVYQTSDPNLIDSDKSHLADIRSSTFPPSNIEEKGNAASEEVKENNHSNSTRQVRMNSQVHVLFEDGNTTLESLADDKCSVVSKVTQNSNANKIEVVDVSKTNPAIECNQQ